MTYWTEHHDVTTGDAAVDAVTWHAPQENDLLRSIASVLSSCCDIFLEITPPRAMSSFKISPSCSSVTVRCLEWHRSWGGLRKMQLISSKTFIPTVYGAIWAQYDVKQSDLESIKFRWDWRKQKKTVDEIPKESLHLCDNGGEKTTISLRSEAVDRKNNRRSCVRFSHFQLRRHARIPVTSRICRLIRAQMSYSWKAGFLLRKLVNSSFIWYQ